MQDLETGARRSLPAPIFDLLAGGAGDEVTLESNRGALEQIRFRPRVLRDVAKRDMSTTVLGEKVTLPVLLSPVGYQRMAHRSGELATARAAAATGTIFALSTVSSYSLEDVAAESSSPRWFQLYVPPDKDQLGFLIERAWRAGFGTLCVTVDAAMVGIRERDLRNQLTVPIRFRPKMIMAAALHPKWCLDFVSGGVGRGFRLSGRWPKSIAEASRAIARASVSVTLEDLDWIRSRWKGSLVVKGVLRGDDATELINRGVDAIVVSNHGGRQLDGAIATIDALTDVVDAVGARAEVFVDGGFRRGADVLKAIAIGAKAVFVGRPIVYGLAVGGQQGVERMLDIFRQEIDTAMGLLGCATLKELNRDYLQSARLAKY